MKLVLCSVDWSSCLRRQRKSEANGRPERAWFRQVLEEYRRRCRIAIAAAVAAAVAAAAAAAAAASAAMLLAATAAAADAGSYCCCGCCFHVREKPSQARCRP